MNYLGALTLANSTYSILQNLSTVSDKIQNLIKLNELNHQDQLNFKALLRRLDMLYPPLSQLLILRQQEQVMAEKHQEQANRKGPNLEKVQNDEKVGQEADGGQTLNTLDCKPIQMAFEFVREIIEFINKMVAAQSNDGQASGSRESISQSSLEQQIKGQENAP